MDGGSVDGGHVEPKELVVVASWVPTQPFGGGSIVNLHFGRTSAGNVLRKREPIRVACPPAGTLVRVETFTRGVAREHRTATFSFVLSEEQTEGVLIVVRCAVGYLWPVRPSMPAQVHVGSGSGRRIPHPRWWRAGFKDLPETGDLRAIAADAAAG